MPTRARRLLSAIATAIVVGASVLAFSPAALASSVLPIPDNARGDAWMECNVNAVQTSTSGTPTYDVRFSCQTPGTMVVNSGTVLNWTYLSPTSSPGTPFSDTINADGGGFQIDLNANGRFELLRHGVTAGSGGIDRTCKGTASSAPAFWPANGAGAMAANPTVNGQILASKRWIYFCPMGTGSAYASFPSDYYPGGTEGSVTPPNNNQGNGDSTDCPTGWSLLNPAVIVTTLRCVFLPSGSALQDNYDTLKTAATTHWPIGPLVDVKDRAGSLNSDAAGSTEASGFEHPGDCSGIEVPLNLTSLHYKDAAGNDTTPGTPMLPLLPAACASGDGTSGFGIGITGVGFHEGNFPAAVDTLRNILWWASTLFGILAGIFMVRSAANRVTEIT